MSGVQNGISERTVAVVPSGLLMTAPRANMQAASGMTRNMLSCWSSCSELVMAPRAAAIEE